MCKLQNVFSYDTIVLNIYEFKKKPNLKCKCTIHTNTKQ